MKEYQQKYIVRTILYSRVTMVILFILLILFIRTIVELNDKRINASKLREESSAERNDLEEKVAKAKNKEESIKTERGFETYVRTTYPVVSEGEGVIVIYDAPTSLVTPVREDMTVWERLLVLWHRFIPTK
ncbi:MAG: hypothetical protein NTW35_02360 [Candidatus Nomurabacteria bacterium]|nr:hypothetical protein [Candidatus Nomurabacteria bacterium]